MISEKSHDMATRSGEVVDAVFGNRLACPVCDGKTERNRWETGGFNIECVHGCCAGMVRRTRRGAAKAWNIQARAYKARMSMKEMS